MMFNKQSILYALFGYGIDTKNIEVIENRFEMIVESPYPIPSAIKNALYNMVPAGFSLIFRDLALNEKTDKINICSCFGPPSRSCAIHGDKV